MKKKIQLDIRWAANSQNEITFDEPVSISYLWVEPNRKRDLDNIMSGQKFIQDSLVQMGVLKNDGWKQIIAINHSFAVDKDKPGVWVKIREV